MNNRQKQLANTLRQDGHGVSEPDLVKGAHSFVKDYHLETKHKKGALLEGVFSLLKAPSGIKVHAVDGVATQELASSFVLPPSFSVTVFLGGYSDVELEGYPIKYGTEANRPLVQIQYNETDIHISRKSRVGERMRKVNITLKEDALQSWLNAGFDFKKLCSGRRFGSVDFSEFEPDAELVSAANAIIAIGDHPKLRGQIELEKLALTILENILDLDPANREEQKLVKAQQARQYIEEHLTEHISLNSVAREVGMSVSNLQRTFKSAFGCTAINYLRQKRLSLAHKLLLEKNFTIGEISQLAGYTSISNFSSAFRKQYGVPPSRAGQ